LSFQLLGTLSWPMCEHGYLARQQRQMANLAQTSYLSSSNASV